MSCGYGLTIFLPSPAWYRKPRKFSDRISINDHLLENRPDSAPYSFRYRQVQPYCHSPDRFQSGWH